MLWQLVSRLKQPTNTTMVLPSTTDTLHDHWVDESGFAQPALETVETTFTGTVLGDAWAIPKGMHARRSRNRHRTTAARPIAVCPLPNFLSFLWTT